MRRIVWFASGVAAGAAGAGYAKRKVGRAAQAMAPTNVARVAAGGVRRTGRRVTDAVREGRLAAQVRERELRAERDGRLVRLGDHLRPGDEVLVDGQPVESGRVILMRRPDK
jgi:predicted deacylase